MDLLANKYDLHKCGSRAYAHKDYIVLEPEGRKEWQTLCPVSNRTGWPCSMQSAVLMISDKNSRLAEMLYQELPTIPQDDRISDDDKLSMLASRLFTGSFAENDELAESLGKIAAEFFPKADVNKAVENAQISFENTETPLVNE